MKKLIPIAIALFGITPLFAEDWLQFRGPNSAGVSDNRNLPVEFGPSKNLVWKTAMPPGFSSPVLVGDHIYLTAVDNEKLFTLCLDRATGKINWRREIPRTRTGELHKANGPASPSPTSDGKNVFIFFYDFGLVSYGPDGNELWRTPLGPFNNPFGLGASPVLVDNTLLISCDQESGSFFLAVGSLAVAELIKLFMDIEHNTRVGGARGASVDNAVTASNPDNGRGRFDDLEAETAEGALLRGH